jgi:hypothetical protein
MLGTGFEPVSSARKAEMIGRATPTERNCISTPTPNKRCLSFRLLLIIYHFCTAGVLRIVKSQTERSDISEFRLRISSACSTSLRIPVHCRP